MEVANNTLKDLQIKSLIDRIYLADKRNDKGI